MNEHYFSYESAYSFMRHSDLLPKRKTLLFLHGIGDSSISFLPFFESPFLNDFNLIAPDLLGHGKSSNKSDYHFYLQCKIIIEQLKSIQKDYKCPLDDIILIAHSMGGIHALMLCESSIQGQIKGLINVEGSITQYGSFVSEIVTRIYDDGHFNQWFNDFKEITIFEKYIKQFPSCRVYYASLQFCDSRAFLQNALEMRHVALEGSGQYTNSAGSHFANLKLPKVYCYGDESLCIESIDFLHKNSLSTKIFHTKCHFVMLDCFDEFIKFMTGWIRSHL